MKRVLVVDDEPNSCIPLGTFLKEQGYDVELAFDGEQAMDIGRSFAPSVLLCDWLLKGRHDGIAVARELWTTNPHLTIIFMTGFSEEDLRMRIGELPVRAVLSKPLSLLSVLNAVEEGFEGH